MSLPPHIDLTRRQALRRLALGAAGLATGCKLGSAPELPPAGDGRLAARPTGSPTGLSPGEHRLLLSGGRDGVLYMPPGLSQDSPFPMILLLHGAGGTASGLATPTQPYAEQLGFAVLAPDSRGGTWDAIRGTYSVDVDFIDAALARAFELCNVDPTRIGVAGFSDGATYAIGLGRLNGDLFRRVVAFSPGFLIPANDVFKPPIYITHGRGDNVLPLELTSRVIVEELTRIGYDVTLREFDGGHWIPALYATEAFGWLIGGELQQPPPEPPAAALGLLDVGRRRA
ncbi:MAG TPA: PHB depolymerase family esterase [Gemmatimonadaceae bacterium]|nr:PHB depolymerase family esterase [Gemmatimonadaceae bacterium]